MFIFYLLSEWTASAGDPRQESRPRRPRRQAAEGPPRERGEAGPARRLLNSSETDLDGLNETSGRPGIPGSMRELGREARSDWKEGKCGDSGARVSRP